MNDSANSELELLENQIFLYLRLRDERRTIAKSRIREFNALGRTTVEFLKSVWKRPDDRERFETLKNCSLEYVEANSEIILISIRKDLVKRQWIIAGLIPKNYQKRMLNEKYARIKFTAKEFLNDIVATIGPDRDSLVRKRIIQPTSGTILSLIRNNIQDTGEFYIEADLQVVVEI